MPYLRALAGDGAMIDAFLDTGAAALRFFEASTELRFALVPRHPDYRQEIAGAVTGGRCAGRGAATTGGFSTRSSGASVRRARSSWRSAG